MSHHPTLCPWLGTEEDRGRRHTEPVEAHLCYAQKRPAGIELDYQARFCLSDEHRACQFYLDPPPPPAPEPLMPAEDEVGPPPKQFPALQVSLWVMAVLVFIAVGYYYGSALLAPAPTATPIINVGLTPSPTPTHTLTLAPSSTEATTALPAETPAAANPAASGPTATPTPYPGGAIYNLSTQAGAAGWVASDEARGNHLGDSYLYAGVFGGVTYHGVLQFDLQTVPRGATIHAAVLEITGLDARRLGASGVWEVRVLARQADEAWSRHTYQDVHNAAVQWTLPPALGADDLVVDEPNTFELSGEQLRDLEQRLLDEHYTLSFRMDGPLAGSDSLFAWDSGTGPASQGHGPRLWLNVSPPPRTPIPSGSPPPTPTPSATPTPDWFVVTSTPTPANAMTAAAVALQATVRATTTGTPTPLPSYVATATPDYVVVTNTPTPESRATADYLLELATANALLTGTPTPAPFNLATATPTPLPTGTPRPTRTPVVIWLDEITVTPAPTPTPVPTTPPLPRLLRGKILFLSDRGGQPAVYVLDPASGRLGLLTARWPYDEALQAESLSPDGRSRAYVQNDSRGRPQVFVRSDYYGGSWQVTFNTGSSYDPVWSPLGDRLAFVSTEGGNDDIYVINPDGTDQKRLTFNQWEWDKHPSWSPDGSRIVFWSNQDTGRRQIWIMDADGRNRRILLDSSYNDWDPVWVKQ